jgi:hypothetical protein
MVKHLLTAPTYTTTDSGAFLGSGYTWGSDFGVTGDVDVTLTGMRLWIGSGGNAPAWIRLHDKGSGASLVYISSLGTINAGWNAWTLDAPVTLAAGGSYQITGWWQAGSHIAYINPANRGTPDAPLAFGDTFGWNTAGEQTGVLSGDHNAAVLPPLDVELEGTSGGGAGTGGTAQTGDLASWLSNDPTIQAHATDGLPATTKAVVDDTNTKVTSGLNLAGGLQALSDSLANTLQMASDYLAGRTSTYFTDLKNRLIGASGGGGSAFYGAGGTQVSEGVEALLARSTNAQVGFPASPWEMTAETDFDGCLAWDQPADLYTVTFATTPPTIPNNGQCGVPVRYRLAWWAPLNGEFAQGRHWIDFEKVHLVDPAGRMPGLLLQTYLGGTGHVEAWTLNV